MGKKVEPKMVPTKVSVRAFVDGLADERRRREATALISMMKKVTGEKPVMWGPSIIGFGRYHYKYASGREGDAPRAGFSPRSAALTVYCMPGFAAQRTLLSRLGPHKTSVSCLYIRRLDDVDTDVLTAIVERSFDEVNERYPRSGVDGAPAPKSRARRGTSRTGERRKRRESKSR